MACVSSVSVMSFSGPSWVLSRDLRIPLREVFSLDADSPAGRTAGLQVMLDGC